MSNVVETDREAPFKALMRTCVDEILWTLITSIWISYDVTLVTLTWK